MAYHVYPSSYQSSYPSSYTPFYGYGMLSGIYNNILNTFEQYPTTYNLRFKTESNKDIQDKLRQIEVLEKEIAEALVNSNIKERLKIASSGVIDPNRIPDKNLPEFLKKHSNLLGLSSNYNHKVKELSETLKEINDVLIKKSGPGSVSVSIGMPLVAPQPTIPWRGSGGASDKV